MKVCILYGETIIVKIERKYIKEYFRRIKNELEIEMKKEKG